MFQSLPVRRPSSSRFSPARAVTSWMCLVWREEVHSLMPAAWISTGLVLGIGSELGQAIGFVPGTFSWPDVGYPLNPISVAYGIEYDFAWALGEIDIGLFADNFEGGTLSAWSSWSP